VIIFGDIHGCKKTLDALLAKIPEEEKKKGIVTTGDLEDRGFYSMEVIQWAIDNNIKVVRGNHEQMMIDEAIDVIERRLPQHTSSWLHNGGIQTIQSYEKIDENGKAYFDKETFKKHIEWMKTLPLYLEFKDIKNKNGDYLLVTHSSAGKVWKWSEEKRKKDYYTFETHLIWGRPKNIVRIDGVFNVFGHTPIKNNPRIREYYANIDTGCTYNKDGYCKLTALQFPEMIVYQQENID